MLFFITTVCQLAGPLLPLWGEHQGCGFPARRAGHDKPASHFQGAKAMADFALSALKGAHEFRVAARAPAVRPLVVGNQPAQDTRVQLGEACRCPPPLLRRSDRLCNRR